MINFAFFDLETDPFAMPGKEDELQRDRFDIAPFSCGCLYANNFRPYFVSWGDDCIAEFMREVDANPVPTIYYAHNGGKFDMRWIMKYLPAQKYLDIAGRMVKATYGIHEFRDSFALFAMKLSSMGGKKEIDYIERMRRSIREKHKVEILEYLQTDCDVLRNAVMGLINESGMRSDKFTNIKPTAASIAFKAMSKEMDLAHKAADLEKKAEEKYNERIEKEKQRVAGKKNAKPKAIPLPFKQDPRYKTNIFGMPYPYMDCAPLRRSDSDSGSKIEWALLRKRKWNEKYRPYYFGGCVRVAKAGVFDGEFTQIDARSMYSTAMVQFAHPIADRECEVPISPEHFILDKNGDLRALPGFLYAVEFIGTTVGILAEFREGVNTLGFRRDLNYMFCHEFKEGLRLGMIEVEKVISATAFKKSACTDFRPFSDKYYQLRKEAKARMGKDKESDEYRVNNARQLYYKTMLASAYGKLAQDYTSFKEVFWKPAESDSEVGGPGKWESVQERVVNPYNPDLLIDEQIGFEKRVKLEEYGESENYYNVLTAASITSAARALLMRKITEVVNDGHEFLYCDTDSVLFSGKPSPKLASGADELGAWAIDLADIYRVAIAGAKTYALYYIEDGSKTHVDKKTGERVLNTKERSKGVRISPEAIVDIAENPGRVHEYVSEAPQSSLHGEMVALVRDVQATAKPVPYGTIADYRARGIEPRQLINADGVRYTEKELKAMETPEEKQKRSDKSESAKRRARARIENESPEEKAKREKKRTERNKKAKENATAKRAKAKAGA